MKKVLSLALAAACMTVAGSALALNNATGNTTIRIITPLNVTDGDSLDFGTVAQINGAACDVTITPDATNGTRSTGGCDLINPPTGGDDATWSVTGEPGFAYDLTLSAVTTMTGPGAPITVDNFTVYDGATVTPFTGPPNGTTGTIAPAGLVLNGAGLDVFSVGGQAHLAASQVPGFYTGTYNLLASYL